MATAAKLRFLMFENRLWDNTWNSQRWSTQMSPKMTSLLCFHVYFTARRILCQFELIHWWCTYIKGLLGTKKMKWTIFFTNLWSNWPPLALKSFFNDKNAEKDVRDLVGRCVVLVLRSSWPAVLSMLVNHAYLSSSTRKKKKKKER